MKLRTGKIQEISVSELRNVGLSSSEKQIPISKLIAGMDLHGNNVVIGVINQDGKRLAHRKVDCDLKQVIEFLRPLKPQLQSAAVESTFNWYWLVDGLRAADPLPEVERGLKGPLDSNAGRCY